jgi:hypothetical protein
MTVQQAAYWINTKAQPGSALVEYAMPGLLLLVITIAGLSAIGISLNDTMGLANKNMNQKISHVTDEQAAHAQRKADFILERQMKASQQASGSGGNMNTAPLCGDGGCSTVLDLNAPIVQTAGTNGQVAQLTSQAANIYTVVAKQLAEQGADSSLINLVTKLANTGHSIANGENNLNGDGFDSMASGIKAVQDGRTNFQNLYNQLTPHMSKLPANSQTQLAKAATVITTIANNYTFNLSSNNADYHYQASSADLTHINSNTICKNGGNTSSCVK